MTKTVLVTLAVGFAAVSSQLPAAVSAEGERDGAAAD
jgi:hypothetical protein